MLCKSLSNSLFHFFSLWKKKKKQTAEEAMTPIESTFSLDVNSKLDWWVLVLNSFSFPVNFILLVFTNLVIGNIYVPICFTHLECRSPIFGPPFQMTIQMFPFKYFCWNTRTKWVLFLFFVFKNEMKGVGVPKMLFDIIFIIHSFFYFLNKKYKCIQARPYCF